MTAIYLAMREVDLTDRSDYFNNYYREVLGRINRHAYFLYKIEHDESRSLADQEDMAKSFLEQSKFK